MKTLLRRWKQAEPRIIRLRCVRSKLKGPVFVASELSGCLLITRRRRGCGEVGIPRFGRDFQARWESLLCDFSTARLLHSLLPIATDPRQTLGVVAPHAMRPIAQAQRSIQVLMQGHRATRQRGSPA